MLPDQNLGSCFYTAPFSYPGAPHGDTWVMEVAVSYTKKVLIHLTPGRSGGCLSTPSPVIVKKRRPVF